MNPAVLTKLERIVERLHALDRLLAAPDAHADQNRFRDLAREHARIAPVAALYQRYRKTLDGVVGAEEMLKEPELRAMAEEEIDAFRDEQTRLEAELRLALLPDDPDDQRNLFLEIRAGTGGDEAALFAGDLFRMYARYAEQRRWKVEIISAGDGEHGGHKELIARVIGRGAYARLKFESGTHRVQRVPETEAQGRIHTSAATVAVLPEADAVDDIPVDPGDLRIDTYRASGAGGQHVNKTDSAIRITHLPTGLVVECQDDRSQHKNRARAMSLLSARLLAAERGRQTAERAATRRTLIGSGDRSERIRTYNFPQGRVTDHRIQLTLYKLEEILLGNLDSLIDPLIQADQADRMAALGDE